MEKLNTKWYNNKSHPKWLTTNNNNIKLKSCTVSWVDGKSKRKSKAIVKYFQIYTQKQNDMTNQINDSTGEVFFCVFEKLVLLAGLFLLFLLLLLLLLLQFYFTDLIMNISCARLFHRILAHCSLFLLLLDVFWYLWFFFGKLWKRSKHINIGLIQLTNAFISWKIKFVWTILQFGQFCDCFFFWKYLGCFKTGWQSVSLSLSRFKTSSKHILFEHQWKKES